MWADQCRNYDRFVEWVESMSPDICVWCEAQSIYKSGTAEKLDPKERYLTDGWAELAARYGHKYWYVGGHRDNYPQVITSRYPIENVLRIVGQRPDSVVSHGAGWACVEVAGNRINIVTLHTWPQAWAFEAANREQSRAEHGGDAYRRMEIEYVCTHTIGTQPDADKQLWMMMGDFNSRSRKDNYIYGYPDNDSRLWVHDYVLQDTPYIDVVAEKHEGEFRRLDGRQVEDRFRILHTPSFRMRNERRCGLRHLHRTGARLSRPLEFLLPLRPPPHSRGFRIGKTEGKLPQELI
ncbi:MAG: endonuclease [Alistipes putredinis]|nr:MAG: endonuclease [Alistipes putredinis]